MAFRSLLSAALASVVFATAVHAEPSVERMRWQRRVLLVSAPDAQNPRLTLQRRIVDEWRREARDRDLSFVEVIGGTVRGAGDPAATLRTRYKLPPGGFMAVLIGKDGGVKLRSPRPISSDTLQGTIDAMPMRQAGER